MRVRFHEPDDDRNIVGDAVVDHGNGAVGLEKINGTTVVVSEGVGSDCQRRVGIVEREKLLPD